MKFEQESLVSCWYNRRQSFIAHPQQNHTAMSDVTQILSAIEQGDQKASEQLLPLVYDALRKLAAAKMAVSLPAHRRSTAGPQPIIVSAQNAY
jgi:hypothetical protein